MVIRRNSWQQEVIISLIGRLFLFRHEITFKAQS